MWKLMFTLLNGRVMIDTLPLNKTTMGDLIMEYVKFLRNYSARTRRMVINLNGVRQHIYHLLS